MSKSKGNVINPVDFIEKYGADAVRMSLVFGVAPGSNIPFSEEKIRGMRNFANKIWNMGRFIQMLFSEYGMEVPELNSDSGPLHADDVEILRKVDEVVNQVTKNLELLHFSEAAELIYEFSWHTFADIYIEGVKSRKTDQKALATIRLVFSKCLKLLHPFMPFVTEAVWRETEDLGINKGEMLILANWPTKK